ncbi:MAG: hypothetical protein U1F77_13655 [Kiritimatiellia bacterium]
MTGHVIGGNGSGDLAIDNLNFRSGTLKDVAQINGGASGLNKTTSGTLILLGTHTYTGNTSVTDGTLLVNGTYGGGGLITVSASATLGGAGQTGDADLLLGGTLSPGQDTHADNWFQAGALSLSPATQLNFDLGAPDDGGASLPGNDLVLAASVPYLGGVINVTPLAGFTAAPGGSKWRLFDLSSGTVPASHNLSLAPDLAANYGIEAVEGASSIYLVAVPEAATSGLVLAGLLMLRRLFLA